MLIEIICSNGNISNPYNASLLKAMMSLAYYCFLRIGEIAVKNRQDTQKVIQINDVHIPS
jgi:integrase